MYMSCFLFFEKKAICHVVWFPFGEFLKTTCYQNRMINTKTTLRSSGALRSTYYLLKYSYKLITYFVFLLNIILHRGLSPRVDGAWMSTSAKIPPAAQRASALTCPAATSACVSQDTGTYILCPVATSACVSQDTGTYIHLPCSYECMCQPGYSYRYKPSRQLQ